MEVTVSLSKDELNRLEKTKVHDDFLYVKIENTVDKQIETIGSIMVNAKPTRNYQGGLTHDLFTIEFSLTNFSNQQNISHSAVQTYTVTADEINKTLFGSHMFVRPDTGERIFLTVQR